MASFLLPGRPQLLSWSATAACFPHRATVGSCSLLLRKAKVGPLKCSNKEVSPWLMLPPSFEAGNVVHNFYSLTNNKLLNFSGGGAVPDAGDGDTEIVGSSQGFLVFFHKRNHKLFLHNPISGSSITLPSIHTLSLYDIGLGPLDMRVTKVVVSDDLSRAVMIFGPANRLAFCCPGWPGAEWIPLGARFITIEMQYTMYARIYRDIVYSRREEMFIGYTDYDVEKWDLRLSRAGQQVKSVYRFKFNPLPYLADVKKYLPAVWDLFHDIKVKFEKYPPWWNGIKDLIDDSRYCNKETYVVFAEHSNQLYVVYRYIMERRAYMENLSRCEFPVRDWDDSYPHKTIGFSVYKVNKLQFNYMDLKYMEGSLDNLVMFLGRNHSFALPAQNYPELKPNSIYFTDNPRHTPLHWQTYGAHDTGIYYFSDRTFHPVFDCPNSNVLDIKGIVPPPIWFTPSQHLPD